MTLNPFPDASEPDPENGRHRLLALPRALRPRRWWSVCAAAFIVGVWAGVSLCGRENAAGCLATPPVEGPEPPAARILQGLNSEVRPAPDKPFGRNGRLPSARENDASGAPAPGAFSPARDLVFVDDPRCWWESDNDGESDDECDHSMHAAAEIPFRRLVNLLALEAPQLQLRVQEAYRPCGSIHSPKSLHLEGRALDLTLGLPGAAESFRGDEIMPSLERLAALAWRAGFDWVLLEWPRGGGPHVHASVRADAPRMRAAPDGIIHE